MTVMHIRCNHQLPLELAADMLLGVVNRQRHTNRAATTKPWSATPITPQAAGITSGLTMSALTTEQPALGLMTQVSCRLAWLAVARRG